MQILNPILLNTVFPLYLLKYNPAARKLGSFEFFDTICCKAVKYVDV
jgi:hypothetical protein